MSPWKTLPRDEANARDAERLASRAKGHAAPSTHPWHDHNHRRGGRPRKQIALMAAAAEARAEFGRLDPIEDASPCVCGSRCRVFSTSGNCYCRRCGRADETLKRESLTRIA